MMNRKVYALTFLDFLYTASNMRLISETENVIVVPLLRRDLQSLGDQ